MVLTQDSPEDNFFSVEIGKAMFANVIYDKYFNCYCVKLIIL